MIKYLSQINRRGAVINQQGAKVINQLSIFVVVGMKRSSEAPQAHAQSWDMVPIFSSLAQTHHLSLYPLLTKSMAAMPMKEGYRTTNPWKQLSLHNPAIQVAEA